MAVVVEVPDSRESTKSAAQTDRRAFLRYTVSDEFDDAAVDVVIEAELPGLYNGLMLQDYSKRHVGGGIWEVVATYGPRRPKEIGSKRFSFDTTGERLKVTHSLSTVGSFVPAGETATDHKQGIQVTSDSKGNPKIEGIEIMVPKLSFTIEETHPNPPLGDTVDALFLKTGSVNSDVINATINSLTISMAIGECLFEGATGGESGVETYEITKRFSFNPNQVALTYGDITVTSKRGWDYLWVSYRLNEDNNKLTTEPLQVNVEQIYPYHTHSELFT